ncbi:MAG: EamA family transporter [Spirochaetales bacterium]|nr:EamA family transporter [Spirochaetales bacterium]
MSGLTEDSPRRASLYALVAGVTWGTSGTLASLLPEGFPSLSIAAFRLFLGGCFLLLFSGKGVIRLFRFHKGEGKALILSVAAISSMMIFFFTAVQMSGVGMSTMIYIGLSPLFAGIIERVVDRNPLERRWFRSVGLTLTGSLLLGSVSWQDLRDPRGLLFAAAASLGWSLTGLSMKRLQKNRGSLEVTTLVMFLGGLVMCPFLFTADRTLVFSGRTPLILMLLGFLSASLPYWLFNRSIRTIPAGHAFVLGMIEPLTAALLGILLLGEPFGLIHLIGYSLIFTGVMLLYLSSGLLVLPHGKKP